MHKKTLITPRYWLAKLNKLVFECRFPEAPWLSECAVYLLDSWLRRTDRGIEWGAGRSTIWLASRVERLTSVESNPKWYENVKSMLHKKGLEARVDLRYVSTSDVVDVDPLMSHPYATVAEEMPDESLDFALVDGMNLRVLCMEKVIPKIKPGGLLVLDNGEWFFPNKVMGQYTVGITTRDKCLNRRWEKLWSVVCNWRSITTTNGVTDTLFWIKPPGEQNIIESAQPEPSV